MNFTLQIKSTKKSFPDVPIILVGNKCDETSRSVPSKEGECIARSWNCPFIETSAKNNHNVRELFQKLLEQEKGRIMTLDPNTKQKKSKGKKRREKLQACCTILWWWLWRHRLGVRSRQISWTMTPMYSSHGCLHILSRTSTSIKKKSVAFLLRLNENVIILQLIEWTIDTI